MYGGVEGVDGYGSDGVLLGDGMSGVDGVGVEGRHLLMSVSGVCPEVRRMSSAVAIQLPEIGSTCQVPSKVCVTVLAQASMSLDVSVTATDAEDGVALLTESETSFERWSLKPFSH